MDEIEELVIVGDIVEWQIFDCKPQIRVGETAEVLEIDIIKHDRRWAMLAHTETGEIFLGMQKFFKVKKHSFR